MDRIVIAGGGWAGLAASLFLARRGHAVTVIERDPPPPPGSADGDATSWRRPGAPQARQSHALLARARRVLRDEAPDVLAAMLERGVREEPAAVGAGRADGDAALLTRRLVAEAVLRRTAEREPGITIRSGDAVTGLEASTSSRLPVVTGVHTESGEVIRARLVVDAGGRRSALPEWLAAVGARPPVDRIQDCGFVYLTRHYRVRPGHLCPPTPLPSGMRLDYGGVVGFGEDNDSFSLYTMLSVRDPHRHAMRDPDRFERFLRAVPFAEPWLAAGTPASEVAPMARIENRRRRIVDANGPIVAGIVPIGDAALHTNPTLGRGVALALWHAQHLAHVIDEALDDPIAFADTFDAWTDAHLGIYFDTQVAPTPPTSHASTPDSAVSGSLLTNIPPLGRWMPPSGSRSATQSSATPSPAWSTSSLRRTKRWVIPTLPTASTTSSPPTLTSTAHRTNPPAPSSSVS